MSALIVSCSAVFLLGLAAVGYVRCSGDFLYVLEGDNKQYRIYFSYDGVLAEMISNSSSGVGRWTMLGSGSNLLTADLSIETGHILDCSMTSDLGSVRRFSDHFGQQTSSIPSRLHSKNNSDLEAASGNSSATFHRLHVKPNSYENLLDFDWMEEQCQHLHAQRNAVNFVGTEDVELTRVKRQSSNFIFPGTKWCGDGSEASSRPQVGQLAVTDRCCRHHDFCPLHIHGLSRRYRLFNYSFFTLSHCNCDLSRGRRAVTDVFRIPGTKWCGKGFTATAYSALGGHSTADRCCRHHDLRCPHWIGSLQTKYGLFNWGISTLNHCKCDARFHTCLKMANSGAADMIGNIFFNVVRTRCFILKRKRVCDEWSWVHQKCTKYRLVKQAYLKEPIAY